MKLNTLAIHSHQQPDPVTGAVITPIYQTSTFAQEDAGIHKGYDYSRSGNPTRTVLEGVLSEMEAGTHGFCFSSGLGALITLCMAVCKAGDHILVTDDVYGGTFRFLTKVFQKFGVESSFVTLQTAQDFEHAVRPNTRMLLIETPSNPTLKLIDIQLMCQLAKAKGILSCVDNTFATPYLQQPLTMGADIVLHSTTKYIGGHSDVVGGALVVRDAELAQQLKFHQNSLGATPDPFASWLTLRGLKTLGVRMRAHCENARELARFLEKDPKVKQVIYPGLPSHPQHALATTQMQDFGGMISVELNGTLETARTFLKQVKLFTLAESLGGIESLIEHPGLMTHLSVDPAVRQALGISDTLIRLSVGIEDVEDLRQDLAQALEAC